MQTAKRNQVEYKKRRSVTRSVRLGFQAVDSQHTAVSVIGRREMYDYIPQLGGQFEDWEGLAEGSLEWMQASACRLDLLSNLRYRYYSKTVVASVMTPEVIPVVRAENMLLAVGGKLAASMVETPRQQASPTVDFEQLFPPMQRADLSVVFHEPR